MLEFGNKSGDYIFSAASIGKRDATNYTVSFLSPGTTYYFRIRAGNGCAVGPWSNEISATTKLEDKLVERLDFTSELTEFEEQSEPSKETYDLDIKVVDEQGNPLEGVKVTLFSEPKIVYTNSQGIARFEDVEKGQHKVVVEKNGLKGEQNVLLEGEVKTIKLNIEVKPVLRETEEKAEGIFLPTPLILIIIGVFLILLLSLFFILKKKRLLYLKGRH